MKRKTTVLRYLRSSRSCDGLPVLIECHLSQGMLNALGVLYKDHVRLCMSVRVCGIEPRPIPSIFKITYFENFGQTCQPILLPTVRKPTLLSATNELCEV